MQVQKVDNTCFKAANLASAEARLGQAVQKFDLYRATKNDADYLEKLKDKINLKELMPNLKPDDYILWQRILNMLLYQSKFKPQETILLAKDNKICGGLKYTKERSNYFVDAFATWPIQPGKRELFAGKVLMLELFNLFMQDDNFSSIRACVARQNPFDPLSKVFELGFRSIGGDNYNEIVSIARKRLPQFIEKFAKIVSFKEINEGEDINLEDLESQQ